MVGHQADHTVIKSFAAQKPGAIERMEAGDDQVWRIPHVVQPRRHHDNAIHASEMRRDLRGASCDPLDVPPTTRGCVGQQLRRHCLRSPNIVHQANLSGQ